MDSTTTPAPSGVAAELASAGFAAPREVGRGGVGVVYSCYHASLRREVAVKVLTSASEEDSRKRFLREGYAMGGLSGHPHIVNILQVGLTEGNRPYIVMPYLAADSLGRRLHLDGPTPWPEALRIGVKLCGALETAHTAGTLHGNLKPGNVLVGDDGEPQLADFGHVAAGYETKTGFFTGDTIAYTAPEVLAGNPPTAAADIYSLGATLYALIAGGTARNTGGDLIAHYLGIGSALVPNLRPKGIPEDVCASIETAMSRDPAKRQPSAAEFGRELQAAQHRNAVAADLMVLSDAVETCDAMGMPAVPDAEQAVLPDVPGERAGAIPTPVPDLADIVVPALQTDVPAIVTPAMSPARHPGTRPVPAREPELWPLLIPPQLPAGLVLSPKKRRRRPNPAAAAAAIGAMLLVLGGVYLAWLSLVASDRSLLAADSSEGAANGTETTTAAPAVWQPITSARIARGAVAATQADGTIWILGGIGEGGVVSGRLEGYDPPTDAWKGGDDLPVPVRHAMSVTWRDTPVVLGGGQSFGRAGTVDATDRVWRLVSGRWVELPRMLQPRAAAAAAMVGDRIIVTGGVDANGALLNTTEIFDGNSWILGAELPTPRALLAAASDGTLMYAVGGTDGTSDMRSVEAYDPVANVWTTLPDLPQASRDLGVTIADGRLLAVGGLSARQVLKSVAALDLPTLTWAGLPDMGTARHGMAVVAMANSVYAIGGSTGVGDREVTSSAEALTLPARETQPA